ncbi:MAG TPA: hypothetical protein DCQ92_06280 [Verrucomicrobia subdivision 3 bacterium]|nr:hypothetical protein [Limisphaerales bacterium]
MRTSALKAKKRGLNRWAVVDFSAANDDDWQLALLDPIEGGSATNGQMPEEFALVPKGLIVLRYCRQLRLAHGGVGR